MICMNDLYDLDRRLSEACKRPQKSADYLDSTTVKYPTKRQPIRRYERTTIAVCHFEAVARFFLNMYSGVPRYPSQQASVTDVISVPLLSQMECTVPAGSRIGATRRDTPIWTALNAFYDWKPV